MAFLRPCFEMTHPVGQPFPIPVLREVEVKTKGERFCSLIGKTHADFVSKIHSYVTVDFLKKWTTNVGRVDPERSSVADLRGVVTEMMPELNVLGALHRNIQKSASLYSIEQTQGCFALAYSLLAYVVHKFISTFWNLATGTIAREKNVQQFLELRVGELPRVSLGQLKEAQGSWEGTLFLQCALDMSEGSFSVSASKLSLTIGLREDVLMLELERTHDNGLVVSMGEVDETKACMAMRTAIELMNATNFYGKVWLKYSGNFDFKTFGFEELGAAAPPLSQGKGEKWVVFHQQTGFATEYPALADFTPHLAENPRQRPQKWPDLIKQSPLLEINFNTGFFEKEAIRVLPQRR